MNAMIRPAAHVRRCKEKTTAIATPNMAPTKGFKASRNIRLVAVRMPERSLAAVKAAIDEKRRELLVIAVPLDIEGSSKVHMFRW